MTPIWLAFLSGIVTGAFLTLVSVAAFMMWVAAKTGGRKAAED